MNNLIDEILTDWSYRVPNGMPDPTNNYHLLKLDEAMSSLKLPRKFRSRLINKLRGIQEADAEVMGPTVAKAREKAKQGQTYSSEKAKKVYKKGEEDENGEKDETQTSQTVDGISKNRSDIFNNQVSGKGGGTTSLQEEIAGISREMAQKYPNDTPEQHQQRVLQFIKDNYGDTKFGSSEKMITGLIKKSASGQQTMVKIKSNESMKFKEEQPEGYPLNITFTDGGTKVVRNSLEEKLKNAKTPEEKAHYKRELKYFIKHATSETGVEGDGDTAIMYEDTGGNMRVVYISNKQSLGDPHSNATVKSAAEAIKASRESGTNEVALVDRLDGAVEDAIDANKTMAIGIRDDINQNIEELNEAPLGKIGTKLLTGRAEFTDKTTTKYIRNARKNKQVQEYIQKNGLDINNDEHIVQACMMVAGSGDADGLNDSTKQAPNKLVFKMANATTSIRKKMQSCIGRGGSPEQCAEKVAVSKQKGKPLLGGNLTAEDCISIYNNKALEKLEQQVQKRKDAMQKAHEDMYNSVAELDVAHYMEQGMEQEEALEKYNREGGPNERTYTRSFMKRMHWDRYIGGDDDDKKMIEVGDKSYSPKDFRNCLGSLTGFDGKGSLKNHMEKNMRIKPGTMSLMFVTEEGKEVHIGDDTWRTAGDLSKIAGGLGKDMQKCLGGK